MNRHSGGQNGASQSADVPRPPSTPMPLGRPSPAVQRGLDDLMLLIESEKAKACEVLRKENLVHENQFAEFRSRAAEALAAALTRITTTQSEAHNRIRQANAEAERSAQEIRDVKALLASKKRDVATLEERYSLLQKDIHQISSTKDTEIDSLKSRISWLEAELQKVKHNDEKMGQNFTMSPDCSSGIPMFSTGDHEGGADLGYLDQSPSRDMLPLQDGLFLDPIDQLFRDVSPIFSAIHLAPPPPLSSTSSAMLCDSPTVGSIEQAKFQPVPVKPLSVKSLSISPPPSVGGARSLSPTLPQRDSPLTTAAVVTASGSLGEGISQTPPPPARKRRLVIPSPESTSKPRTFKMRVSPPDDEESRTCIRVHD